MNDLQLCEAGPEAGTYVRVGSTNRRADAALIGEMQRFARGEAFDERPMPHIGSEAISFRDIAKKGGVLETLVAARRRITGSPVLLRDTLKIAKMLTPDLGAPVLEAIGTLQIERWVYLKDTKSYSVFMDPSGEFASGVRALT